MRSFTFSAHLTTLWYHSTIWVTDLNLNSPVNMTECFTLNLLLGHPVYRFLYGPVDFSYHEERNSVLLQNMGNYTVSQSKKRHSEQAWMQELSYFVQCRLSRKIYVSCVGTKCIICLSSDNFHSGARPHMCGVFNVLMICLSSRRWFVLCLVCVPHLGAGTGVPRYGRAPSTGPNWVGFIWRRTQNPVSEN
jgi:hypothetical protein